MKIVIFDAESWEKDIFSEFNESHQLIITDEHLTKKNANNYKDADIISIFIYSKLEKDLLKVFRKLKLITTRSKGVDHIDINYCNEHNILVSNVTDYSENTVAEHVFALLLTISHRMVDSIERTRSGNFSSEGLIGFDLYGKTIGIIGTGNIGKNVIKIAQGFDMNIVAFDVNPDREFQKNHDYNYVSFNELLSSSDIISIHVPLNEKTEQMISNTEFEKMKNNAILINTSRGNIIDIQALINALKTDKLKAVGLDVLPDEPEIHEEAELLRTKYREKHDLESLLADHILLNMANVYVTPHSAFNTTEAVARILKITINNIRSYINHEPINLLTEMKK